MTSSPSAHFARVLREELEARGVSRKAFAGTLGVSRNTVSSWTTGRYRPDHEHSARIAAALGMSIDQLHGRAPARRAGAPAASEPGTGVPASGDAERILQQLVDLDLDRALEAMQAGTPDLLRILAEARASIAAR